ncbi:MAG: hypothetical protein AAB834_07145 [Patescibacteria group bacterium]
MRERADDLSTGILSDQDQRIRSLLHNTLASTPWATDMFARASAHQKDFFSYVAHPDTTAEAANQAYGDLLGSLVDMTNVQIKYGHENVGHLKDSPAIIVASNHLGIGQVGGVDNRNRTFDFPGDEIEAFPLGMLPGYVISRLLTGKIQMDIRKEEIGDLGMIRRKLLGIFVSDSPQGGGIDALVRDINRTCALEQQTFLLFPEGRTSGWANDGGPYDLDVFKAGTFVIGCKTGIPILPVCQYFDPHRGLDLLVLPPLQLGEEDLENVHFIKDATRHVMQIALQETAA